MVTEAVLDSSVIVALVTLEKHSDWVSNKMKEYKYYHILDLSFYEVDNAVKYKVSDSFSQKDAAMAYKQAEKMMNLYAIHNYSEAITDSLNVALELNISLYDAAFLVLADKLDKRLLTLDEKLSMKLECTKYFGLIEYPNKQFP